MNNRQNTYNHPPQGEQMPPFAPIPPQMGIPMRLRRRMTWREKWMQRIGMDTIAQAPTKGALTIPNWLTGKAMVFFFVAMFTSWFAFGYVPEFTLWFIAVLSVVLFFYGGQAMSKSWERTKEKIFVRNVFIAGVVIRLLWVLYCYFIFNPEYYGAPVGDRADVEWYMPFGKAIAEWLKGESKLTFSQLVDAWNSAMDDWGYPMWLAIEYVLWGEVSDVFMPMFVKCIVGGYCAICIYHVTKRHFGEGTARLAAIFVCVNPNMIYWCGTMFKEVEMVFLVCLAVDNFDRVLNSGQRYTFKSLLPGMLAATALFFFRSALGIVLFLAVFAHIIMASNRVMSFGKKVLAGVIVASVLIVSMGERIRVQSEDLIEKVQSDSSQKEIEWRGKQKNAAGRQQSFAKYAGAAVFAPLIFTLPFPTFNMAHEGHLLQVQLSGGSYIKNILSFFVILVMLMMLISGEWRRHVFILAYTLGYLIVLVLSAFAQSGRFHMPIWPMILLFAAYGVQIAKTNARVRKWLPIVLVIEVVACLAWNWFKLKGRGMI